MFKNLFGNNKIKVEFINASTGDVIGVSNMKPEQLPETFELETTMSIAGEEWTVVTAEPVHSKDFIASKSLRLMLQKPVYVNPKDILYTLPTISNELPGLIPNAADNGSRISFHEDNWRQREFLRKTSLPFVEVEINAIKNIWKKHHKKVEDRFNAFDALHVRTSIGLPNLDVDFIQLQEYLGATQTGQAFIEEQGFIKNGFSIETRNTVYVGIAANDRVSELCILTFNDQSIHEIGGLTRLFDLLFVDWYNAMLITE